MEPLQTALGMAEQTGDITLQARCLAYLTVAYRQCGPMEETPQWAARTLQAATVAHMPEYAGIAKANQAWMAWLAGNLAQTQELGHAALALWRQLPAGHASAPFQWLALWPLIGAALHEERLALAIDYAAHAARSDPTASARCIDRQPRSSHPGLGQGHARIGACATPPINRSGPTDAVPLTRIACCIFRCTRHPIDARHLLEIASISYPRNAPGSTLETPHSLYCQ